MIDLEDLNTGDLDDQALALTYGTTYVRGKTNKLLEHLGRIFAKAHSQREGKISLLPAAEKKEEPEIDFTNFDVDELGEALNHFLSLASAFEQTGRESSAKFCQKLASLIHNAQIAQSGIGHA